MKAKLPVKQLGPQILKVPLQIESCEGSKLIEHP